MAETGELVSGVTLAAEFPQVKNRARLTLGGESLDDLTAL